MPRAVQRVITNAIPIFSMATKDVLDRVQPGVEHDEIDTDAAGAARSGRVYNNRPLVRLPAVCTMSGEESRPVLLEARLFARNAALRPVNGEDELDVRDGVLRTSGLASFDKDHEYVVRVVDPDTERVLLDADGDPIVIGMKGSELRDVADLSRGTTSFDVTARVFVEGRAGDRTKPASVDRVTRKSRVEVLKPEASAPEAMWDGRVNEWGYEAFRSFVYRSADGGPRVGRDEVALRRDGAVLDHMLVTGVASQYCRDFLAKGEDVRGLSRYRGGVDSRKVIDESDGVPRERFISRWSSPTFKVNYDVRFDEERGDDMTRGFRVGDCRSTAYARTIASDPKGNLFELSGFVSVPWKPVEGYSVDENGDVSRAFYGRRLFDRRRVERTPDSFRKLPEVSVSPVTDGGYHVEVKGAAMDLLLDKDYEATMTNVMVQQIGADGQSVRVDGSVVYPFHRESMALRISGQSLIEATSMGNRMRPLSYNSDKEVPLLKAVVPEAVEAPVRAASMDVEVGPPSTREIRFSVAKDSVVSDEIPY